LRPPRNITRDRRENSRRIGGRRRENFSGRRSPGRTGPAHGGRRRTNEDRIAPFIAAGGLRLLPFAEADARAAVELGAHLKRQARPIGPHDGLFAGQARRASAALVMANGRGVSACAGVGRAGLGGNLIRRRFGRDRGCRSDDPEQHERRPIRHAPPLSPILQCPHIEPSRTRPAEPQFTDAAGVGNQIAA